MTEKDDEIAALKARLEALEQGKDQGGPPPPTAPLAKKKGGCANVVIGLAVLVGILLMLGHCVSGGSNTSPSTVTSSTWTPPEGYSVERTRNGDIGYKWSKAARSECRSGVSCWAMDVVTEKGCPRSLYVSIALVGSTDQNVGWTNDTAQGVDAGESVRLVFTTYERGAETAKIADVSCY